MAHTKFTLVVKNLNGKTKDKKKLLEEVKDMVVGTAQYAGSQGVSFEIVDVK
jgi:hypothetical protein